MFDIHVPISKLVEKQIPSFYREQKSGLVNLIVDYYRWLEQEDNVLYKSRSLLSERDIYNASTLAVNELTRQYLLSFPARTSASKITLIRHALNLYKVKGTDLGIETLFRAIYNKHAKVYLPGDNILKPSDGQWYRPEYIEVTNVPNLQSYVGKTIQALGTRATAVVENYQQIIVNRKTIDVLFLSNARGIFRYGDYVRIKDTSGLTNIPRIVGSLTALSILNGGAGFVPGETLNVYGSGTQGKAKVVTTSDFNGRVSFALQNPGSGYKLSTLPIIRPQVQLTLQATNTNITTGQIIFTAAGANGIIMASNTGNKTLNLQEITPGYAINATAQTALYMVIGRLTNTYFTVGETITQMNGPTPVANGIIFSVDTSTGNTGYYVRSVRGSFSTSTYNANGVPQLTITGNTSGANGFLFSTTGGNTGTVTISEIVGGGEGASFRIGALFDQEYISVNTDYIRNFIGTALTLFTTNAAGTATASLGGNTVTGSGSAFNTQYAVGQYLRINSGANGEIRRITAIANATSLSVDDLFTINHVGVQHFRDQASYNFQAVSGVVDTENLSTIIGTALSIEESQVGSIQYLAGINPGRNYNLDPYVTIEEPSIAALLLPDGLGSYKGLNANVAADAGSVSGVVTGVLLTDRGFGYERAETVTLESANSPFVVTARAIVLEQGLGEGEFLSTRGFLSSDQYIQDPYYQEFSYEIQTDLDRSAYLGVVNRLAHPAGTRMYSKFLLTAEQVDTTPELVYTDQVQSAA